MREFISTAEMPNEVFARIRRRGIGGTDAAAILGLSEWKSAIQVYIEKTKQEPPKDLSQNELVEWGRRLEKVVAEKYAECHPQENVCETMTMYLHDDYDFIIANFDRLIYDKDNTLRAVLECKTTNAFTGKKMWGTEDNPKIPVHYQYQGYHYMAVSDVGYVVYAILIGGNHYIERILYRDEKKIKELIDAEIEFWGRVQNLEPPIVDGSSASAQYIRENYNEVEPDKVVKLRSEHLGLLIEIDKLTEQYKMLGKEIDAKKNQIKVFMDKAEFGETKGAFVKFKQYSGRLKFDSKRFKTEHPELAEKYYAEGKSYRKFEYELDYEYLTEIGAI